LVSTWKDFAASNSSVRTSELLEIGGVGFCITPIIHQTNSSGRVNTGLENSADWAARANKVIQLRFDSTGFFFLVTSRRLPLTLAQHV
jgi:hypothetical protein